MLSFKDVKLLTTEYVADRARWFFENEYESTKELPFPFGAELWSDLSVWVVSEQNKFLYLNPPSIPKVVIIVDDSKTSTGEENINRVLEINDVQAKHLQWSLGTYLKDFAHIDYPDMIEIKSWQELRRSYFAMPRKYTTSPIDMVLATMVDTTSEPLLEKIFAGEAICVHMGSNTYLPKIIARILPWTYEYTVQSDNSVLFKSPSPKSKPDQGNDITLMLATNKDVSDSLIKCFASKEELDSWLKEFSCNNDLVQLGFDSVASVHTTATTMNLPLVTYVESSAGLPEYVIEPVSAKSAAIDDSIVFSTKANL